MTHRRICNHVFLTARLLILILAVTLSACTSNGAVSPATPYIAFQTSPITPRSAILGTPFPSPTPAQSPISVSNASKLTQLACYGGQYRNAAWAPSGDRVAFVTTCGISIHSAANLEQIKFFRVDVTVSNIAYSIDSKTLLVGNKNVVELWDANSGQIIRSLTGHTGDVIKVAFSPDGRLIASGGKDGTLRLWATSTGQAISTFASPSGPVLDIAFSSDSNLVAAGNDANATVSIWDTKTGQFINSFERRPHELAGIAFKPNTESILSSSISLSWVWDAKSGTQTQSFILDRSAKSYYRPESRHAAFSPDGHTVAIADQLLDFETRKMLLKLGENLNDLSFSPDGKKLLTVHFIERFYNSFNNYSFPSEVKIWDYKAGQVLAKIQGPTPGKIQSVALNTNDKSIAVAEGDNGYILDVRTGQKTQSLGSRVNAVAFSPDGQRLVTGMQEGVLQIRDTDTYSSRGILNGHTRAITRVMFSLDGQKIFSISQDGTAQIWDAKSLRNLQTVGGGNFAISPDGSKIAAVRDGIYLVDASSGTTRKFSDNLRTRSLNFSNDGQLIAIDGVLFDVATGGTKNVLPSTVEVIFSRDDRILLGRNLTLWDSSTGSLLWDNKCSCSEVRALAMSPDMRWIISGHTDSGIRIWGIKP
jgi:WD40 repeat protein